MLDAIVGQILMIVSCVLKHTRTRLDFQSPYFMILPNHMCKGSSKCKCARQSIICGGNCNRMQWLIIYNAMRNKNKERDCFYDHSCREPGQGMKE
jgi:hypothetical protein